MTFITGNFVKVRSNNSLLMWVQPGDIGRIVEIIEGGAIDLYHVSFKHPVPTNPDATRAYWLYESDIALASAEEIEASKKVKEDKTSG